MGHTPPGRPLGSQDKTTPNLRTKITFYLTGGKTRGLKSGKGRRKQGSGSGRREGRRDPVSGAGTEKGPGENMEGKVVRDNNRTHMSYIYIYIKLKN